MAFLAPLATTIFGTALGVGSLAGVTGSAGAIAAAGAGIIGAGAYGASSLLKSQKSSIPAIGPAPSAPKPGDSLQQAQKDAAARLRTIRSTGGQTIYTSPLGAQVPSQNVALKSLLG